MKTIACTLGAWLCLAVSSHAVLWTGTITFHVDKTLPGQDPANWGFPQVGGSFEWDYVYRSDTVDIETYSAFRELGFYGSRSRGIIPRDLKVSGAYDPFWDAPYDMTVRDGTITSFNFSSSFFGAYRDWEGPGFRWGEDGISGRVIISNPRRISASVPDGGSSTLPLSAVSIFGLTALRLKSRR